MDTSTVNALLKNTRCYLGTYARDMLPSKIYRPGALIANTDPARLPGEHWVAMVFHSDGTGEYFDPYGLPPLHDEFITYMNYHCPLGWAYNPITLQCLSCVTCGHYCVLYVKFICNGKTYCDYISLFTYNNPILNDKIIRHLVNQ